MASHRKDIRFRVASPCQPGAASSQWEAGGERERHLDIVRIDGSTGCHVTCGLDGGVLTIPSLLTACWVFCHRRTHQRLRLPSLVLSPQLYSSARQEAISKWRTRAECVSPSTRPRNPMPSTRWWWGMTLFREFQMLLGNLCASASPNLWAWVACLPSLVSGNTILLYGPTPSVL